MAWQGIDQWLGGPHEPEMVCLGWDELRGLARSGWEVGSHTCSHPHLTTLDDAILARELSQSRAAVEHGIGQPCRSIAYPYGDVDARVIEATRAAGYELGASLPGRPGSTAPLDWPRVGVYHGDDMRRFKLKVSPLLLRVRGSGAWAAVAAARDRRCGGSTMAPAIIDGQLSRARKFLSAGFEQPLGSFVGTDSVRGYYIDLSVKAKRSDWPGAWPWAPGEHSWIALAQLGLGANERWLAGDGEEWLALARNVADMMCANQVAGGVRDGAWEHGFDLPHTYDLRAPWISAMGQGEGASLLVRLHLATGEERYAEAAVRALAPLRVAVADGGTAALLDGRPFPQEYPTSPPSFVLNGMFAMWGLYDAGLGLDDRDAADAFEQAVDTLAANLHRWDTGSWSLYDLYPHPVANWASLAYHELHASQLRAMAALAPRPEFTATADRFERYQRSPTAPAPRDRAQERVSRAGAAPEASKLAAATGAPAPSATGCRRGSPRGR